MTAFQLSLHAQQRAVEMGLSDQEIVATTNQPEVCYPADRRHGHNRQIRKRGRLCAVHGQDGTVITFLWSGNATDYQRWTRPQ